VAWRPSFRSTLVPMKISEPMEHHPLVVPSLEPKYPSRTTTGEKSPFVGSSRFAVLLVLFFCNTIVYLVRINMSVAIVYMYRDDQEFEKSVVLSSFYWGYASSQILAGYLAARYGGRIILVCSMLGCGICTCMIPLNTSMRMVVAMRALIGVCQGANYPSQMILLSKWIPWFERSRALSIISAGESLGTIVALFGGPYLVSSTQSWESIFWLTGLTSIVAFAVVFLVLFEGPEEMHRSGLLSSREIQFIQSGRSIIVRSKSVPWGQFFRSVPYLSCICIHFCSDWGYLLILCYLPSYWRNVYQVSDSQMAFFSVLPCIGIPIVSILGATFADWLLSRKVSLLAVRKGMSALGLWAPAICFHLLSYCKPCKASCPAFWFALGVMVLGVSLRGFQTGGWASNYLDIGPSYVSHLFSIANSIGATSGVS